MKAMLEGILVGCALGAAAAVLLGGAFVFVAVLWALVRVMFTGSMF